MKQDTARQSAAAKARIRRLRDQYRRRMIAVMIIFFILGGVAGVFGHKWYVDNTPRTDETVAGPEVTPHPEDTQGNGGEFFPEAEAPVEDPEDAAAAELDAFPEVRGNEPDDADATEAPVIFPEDGEKDGTVGAEAASNDTGTPDAGQEAEPMEGKAPAEGESKPGTPDQSGSDVGEDIFPETDAAPASGGESEAEAASASGDDSEGEAAPASDEASAQETAGAQAMETPESQSPGTPQVIAIVPFGESFTYTTQINADGGARVEVTDDPYETISFTQTMRSFMRPSDFAQRYSTSYILTGEEAGAGFELILNDYTGQTTIVPQNVVDISLRSESGNTVERGYQLMDAPISGNYGVALTTNTPMMLYKRYPYSDKGEEMAYLEVTTYNDGEARMILFQLESDEPEATPEPVYTILQKGLQSDEVAKLQARLIDLGYLTGTADGNFGAQTEEAIKKAQAVFGLEQTGIADAEFQKLLYADAPPTPQPGTFQTLQSGDTGDAVVELQLRLRALGYYTGKADGGYGPMTVTAVKKAQAAFGLEQTGIADSALQEKLFEGVQPTAAPETSAEAAAEAEPAAETEPTAGPERAGEAGA